MDARATAVGRIGPDGPWVGFAPTDRDRYALVVGSEGVVRTEEAGADLLVALAIAYFEDALHPPPDELAATHGDVATLVRHLVAVEADAPRRSALAEAVDAIDDGLAADVVVRRLTAALSDDAASDPIGLLTERALAVSRRER